MSHQPDELLAQLEELNQVETDKIGEAADLYVRLKLLHEDVGAAKSAAYNKLMEIMEEQGLDSVGTSSHKVTRKSIKSWGIAEGDNPDEHLANIQAARDWYNQQLPHNPDEVKPTTTMLKKAWDAELASNPDAPLPSFLVEHERGQLSVRKA